MTDDRALLEAADRLHARMNDWHEDALDARREMDGDRYDELREDDDRQRARDINTERRLMGFR